MGEKKKVGKVFTYFSKIGVAGIKITEGELSVGDSITIEGHTTNFGQRVDSIQMDHGPVRSAKKGDEVGIKVKEMARNNDLVYRIIE